MIDVAAEPELHSGHPRQTLTFLTRPSDEGLFTIQETRFLEAEGR
jgi:hypothetical protein